MIISTNKGTINPLNELNQRLMDLPTRWDHYQPPQITKLFTKSNVCDLDLAWSKLIKCEVKNQTFDILEWKLSMLMIVTKIKYHTYFPMLMEMNTIQF